MIIMGKCSYFKYDEVMIHESVRWKNGKLDNK